MKKRIVIKNNKGITLVALVITIIVLLMLASIVVYNGTGTVKYSKYMSLKTEMQLLQSKIDEFYSTRKDEFSSKGIEMTEEQKEIFNASEVYNVLESKEEDIETLKNEFKYYTKDVLLNDLEIEGITNDYYINIEKRIIILTEPIEYNGVNYYMLEQMEDGGYNVSYNKSLGNVTFNVNSSIIDGEKGLIQISDIKCETYVEKWQIRYREKGTDTWNIINEFIGDKYDIYVSKITDYEIEVFHDKDIKSDIITVSVGKPIKPEESELTGINKTNGVIEIAFLKGTGYQVTNSPNEPILKEGMKAVYWDENGKEITEGDSDFDRARWYDYVAQSSGTENGGTSQWANAKVTVDGVDSYFVWIPRYAYRIVYFDTEQNEKVYRNRNAESVNDEDVSGITGYSDARGIVDSEGKQIKNISQDMAISVNEKYFKPHPAFEDDVNFGGWSDKLEGIWVAKYEASKAENNKPKFEPETSSWKRITIGDMYTYSKEYNADLNSHLMKNSEWGAIAYLTESKYGRNGTEVTINNGNLTGNAGDTTSSSPSTTINAYNTEKGMLASSTGNIYGIYDLSGGCYEYVAGYYYKSTSLSYGSTFANADNISDKYSTAYQGTNSLSFYKYGDATYETEKWNGDNNGFVSLSNGFFRRGGYSGDSALAGIFYFNYLEGNSEGAAGFRICLAIL